MYYSNCTAGGGHGGHQLVDICGRVTQWRETHLRLSKDSDFIICHSLFIIT